MWHVLVVEDTPDQAHTISGLLRSEGFEVTAVDRAAKALEIVTNGSQEEFDLVLTDLHMPEMDGLALVEELKDECPSLPVVLMTAFGSEQTAFEALKHGAASYIPKAQVFEELVDTLTSLLEVQEARREKEGILKQMTRCEWEFSLGNDSGLIPALVGYLEDELMLRFGSHQGPTIVQVGVALSEAVLNAIHHGNLEVGSDLREEDQKAYYDLIRARRKEDPYRERKVHIHATIDRDHVTFKVTDDGLGFQPREVRTPQDPANLLKVSGRGLFLISTFMDSVSHNDKGNQIVMSKKLPLVASA